MKTEPLFHHITEERRQIDHAIELLGRAIAHLQFEASDGPNLGPAIQWTTLVTEILTMSHNARKKGRP